MPTTALIERASRDRITSPVAADGLLRGVRRPCPAHRCDGTCVAQTQAGRLVFWCPQGAHHFCLED